MSLTAVAVMLLAATAFARPKWDELEGYNFDKFIVDFNRQYEKGTEEYKHREAIFNRRLHRIREHNKDKKHSWRRGVNLFTDMSDEEWKRLNVGAKKNPNRAAPTRVHSADPDWIAPESVDWRNANPAVLTAIKHQGSCGSCWAHSATETIESHYALTTGMLSVFSQSQINSCTPAPSFGCDGGSAVDAYMYINSTTHGLTEEWAYSYQDFFYNYRDPNATTTKCKNVTDLFPNKTPYSWFAELNRAGVRGYVSITPNDARSTMHALATQGPLSISVAAGNWQDYESGVMTNIPFFGEDNEWAVDHDVQMVGYGYDRDIGMGYWIVRNSWSTLWGEAGYVRLFRSDNPADEPCSPPSYGPVCGTSGCLNDPHFPLVFKHKGQDF